MSGYLVEVVVVVEHDEYKSRSQIPTYLIQQLNTWKLNILAKRHILWDHFC